MKGIGGMTLMVGLLAGGALFLACAGVSTSNVGTPSGNTRFLFDRQLASLHIGMPADSLELLFPEAAQPGQTGILHRARYITADFEQVTYSLGWKSDPKHQTGVKAIEDIDVERARVLVENARVISITLFD